MAYGCLAIKKIREVGYFSYCLRDDGYLKAVSETRFYGLKMVTSTIVGVGPFFLSLRSTTISLTFFFILFPFYMLYIIPYHAS